MSSNSVDVSFIEELEGNAIVGYIPLDVRGKPLGRSGVTIGMGIDLGQQIEEGLQGILPQELINRVEIYLGKRGKDARETLAAFPLHMDAQDVLRLNEMFLAKSVEHCARVWNSFSTGRSFHELSKAQRTVVYSVCHQYGTPWKRCPRFWSAAVCGEWEDVIAELRDFGDDYRTRRRKEARYLLDSMKVEC